MSLIQTMRMIRYKSNLKRALEEASAEELHITLEEVKKEIERRNRKHVNIGNHNI